ncbi:MAG: GDYXXLXY domain-containing protein [Planctomycetaceae bacterium]|jgi:uncharacterized membrane-anchored protein/uncharacterized membrane protein|nr:GDYXXLXY domain-containing protein [Planctomycetaceae bacterium]
MSNFSDNENSDSSFCQTLRNESRLWEADGLLSPQQREAILQRYETGRQHSDALPNPQDSFPLYIRVALTMAVVLIGLAVFLLISFNWKFLSGATKLSIVGGALAASHAGGLFLLGTNRKVLADVTFFFTGIIFGVGIWQVGQVFHLPADFPMGLWLWALGTFLMAMVLGSTPLHLLSAALLAAWIIADSVSGSMGLRPMLVDGYGYVPFSALSLPVFAVIGIGCGLLRQKHTVMYLYAVLLLFWWILQGLSCCPGQYLPFHIAAVGLICMAAAALLKTYHISGAVFGRLGVCLILGGLFVLSFLDYWGVLLYRHHHGDHTNPDFILISVLWAVILPVFDYSILFALFRFNNSEKKLREKFRDNKVVTILAISVAVLWLGLYFLTRYIGLDTGGYDYSWWKDNPLVYGGMISVNVLLVMTTIWLMWTGLKRERGDWFWSGALFFLFWTIVRYIDLFAEFGGMLGTAAIFFVCGLLLFGICYVWAIQPRKNTAEVSEPLLKTFPIPARLNSISRFWQSERNVLMASVLAALVQFGMLGAMVANEMYPHRSGTVISVTTIPVDPRDMFRGDYVILRYSFSNLSTITGGNRFLNYPAEQTVFVTMRQGGELWQPDRVSRNRPKDGVFLRGTVKPYSSEIVYGIESYFVQEGTGKAIEQAMRRDRESVIVELTVAPNGKTAIKTVHVK